MPTPEEQKPEVQADPEIEKIRQVLQGQGLDDSDESIAQFVQNQNNQDQESSYIPYERPGRGLKDAFGDAVMSAPFLQAARFIAAPLAKGFQVLDAIETKTALSGPNALVSPAKDYYKTKFPGTSMRNSDLPEMGDYFRELGVPEAMAATGGFILDQTINAPLYALAGAGLKDFALSYIKGSAKSAFIKAEGNAFVKSLEVASDFKSLKSAFLEHPTGQKFTEAKELFEKSDAWNAAKRLLFKFRNNETVKATEAMLRGEALYDPVDFTARTSLRLGHGEENVAAWHANASRVKIQEIVGKNPAKNSAVRMFLAGDEAGADIATTLSAQEKQVLKGMVETKRLENAKFPERLQYAFDHNPYFKSFVAEDLGSKYEIPTQDLIQKAVDNNEFYLRKSFRIFEPGFNRNMIEPDVYQKAQVGVMKDLGLTETEATTWLENFINTKTASGHLLGTGKFKINKSSLYAQKEMPEWLRNFMVPETDAGVNYYKTMTHLSRLNSHLKLFQELAEMHPELVSNVSSKSHSMLISPTANEFKNVDLQSWGMLAGRWVTPDLYNILKQGAENSDSMENAVLTIVRGIKASKTKYDPTFFAIRNPISNQGFAATARPELVVNAFTRQGRADLHAALDMAVDAFFSKEPKLHPQLEDLIRHNVIGSEAPIAEELATAEDLISIFTRKTGIKLTDDVLQKIKSVDNWASKMTALGDQVWKIASAIAGKRNGFTDPAKLADELINTYPNYAEAPRLAQQVRNSPVAALLANNFFTFMASTHRILLKAIQDPDRAWKVALALGIPAVWTQAMMSTTGKATDDIRDVAQTKPELLATELYNPLNPDFDINVDYLQPYNAKGLFAPLLRIAGATNVSPFEYLYNFTAFSPQYGHQTLLTSAIEAGTQQRDQYGREIPFAQRVYKVIKAAGPSSAGNLMDALSVQKEPQQNMRKGLKILGISATERNPEFLAPQVARKLKQKLQEGEDPQVLIRLADFIGYDGQKMVGNIQKRLAKEVAEQARKNGKQGFLGIV